MRISPQCAHLFVKSGYTALFYAVELSAPGILSALLRRGADPSVTILQEVSS